MEWGGRHILITGGYGFVGSHLSARLKKMGAEVTVASNDIREGRNFLMVDVTKPASLNFEGYDTVFHLAGIASPKICEENPEKAFLVNSYGSLNVMEACRKSGVEKVLLSSSAHVYGIPQYTPIDEKHPLRPVSVYGRSKVAAEHICRAYGAAILRFFNVYGKGQTGEYLIPTIISNLSKQSITLRNFDSIRDFVYVDDVVDAMLLAVNHQHECFNVGSGKGYTPREIAELLFKISGEHHELVSLNMQDRVPILFADVGKAKRLLGWEPKVSLADGLGKCI